MRKLDMSESIGALIVLTSKSMERAAEYEIKQKLGLTPGQWKVILALNLFDGLSQRELAEKIYIDTSTLVPIIDKMEKNGLIERKPDLKDRRHNRLFLTKKSESTVDSIIEIVIQIRKLLYRGISKEEQESMRPYLEKILDNAEKILGKR